jgi:hypothetical protein
MLFHAPRTPILKMQVCVLPFSSEPRIEI